MNLPYALLQKLDEFKSWDDWHAHEQSLFNINDWRAATMDQMQDDLDRPEVILNTDVWKPFSIPYQISPELWELYEDSRLYMFQRFEPEAFSENMSTPGLFGKKCNTCRMWTSSDAPKYCPFCLRELRLMPL